MRTWLRRLGRLLLFALVLLCFLPSLVPPFLDRIYYEGPRSDHFDGERFFNPGGAAEAGPGAPTRFINRFLASSERAEWPGRVVIPPPRPSATTSACDESRRDPFNIEKGLICAAAERSGMMEATWVGHATVLVQAYGLNILTDPIWSERASPIASVGPRRARPPGIAWKDLPKIDLVLVSHNHYDHLDLPTLKALWNRDRPLIVTGLGNETLLRKAGIEARAADWGETVSEIRFCAAAIDPCPAAEIKVTVERNHHWSSRWGTDRNRALWSAFTVHLPHGNIFFAGDTGLGDGSWAREASKRGPIRLAILPIGAYEPRDFMKTHHVNPEEAVAIFEMLRPVQALGVHWGTFQLTFEAINDPPRRLRSVLRARGVPPSRFLVTEAGQSFSVPPAPPRER